MLPSQSFSAVWTSLLCTVALMCCCRVAAEDEAAVPLNWPGFRGADKQGVDTEAVLVTEWDDETNLVWKTPLPGRGASSPIVVSDRVFVTSCSGDPKGDPEDDGPLSLTRHLLCIDRRSGDVVWQADEESLYPPVKAVPAFTTCGGHASSTPVSDGERVYVFYGRSGVYAYDLNGERQWHAGVLDEAVSEPGASGQGTDPDEVAGQPFGTASSPMIYSDLVIVIAAAESRSIQAFDRGTGERRWICESDDLVGTFSTPVLMRFGNQDDVLVSTVMKVLSLDPRTGHVRWEVDREPQQYQTGIAVASPVIGDDLIYTGTQRTFLGVSADGAGVDSSAEVAFRQPFGAYISTPLYLEDCLLVVALNGRVKMVDASSGEKLHEFRVPGRRILGSPVADKDHVFIQTQDAGTVVLDRGSFELLATNRFESDGSGFACTPAISGSRLFLRSHTTLYCVGSSP